MSRIRGAEGITIGSKIASRVRAAPHPAIAERVRRIEKMEYDLLVHEDDVLDRSKPVFTIVLTLHDANRQYVARSLRSVAEQTYPNVELMLVNNGAGGKTEEMVWDLFVANKRAKYLRVPRNLYDPTLPDLDDPIPNLWNAGLFASTGDFVYFLSYDDFLSQDYVERMVALFVANDECCTAAPLVVSIDERGEANQATSAMLELCNRRGTYTDGVELARDYMRGGDMIRFPGGTLVVRSELVLRAGGFDNLNDLGQLFKFAVHGKSGFDPRAKLFWRHHPGQTNKVQKTMGLVYYRNFKTYSDTYGLQTVHREIAGPAFAEEFARYMEAQAEAAAIGSFMDSASMGVGPAVRALGRLLRECPPRTTGKAILSTVSALPRAVYARYAPPPVRTAYRAVRRVLRPYLGKSLNS